MAPTAAQLAWLKRALFVLALLPLVQVVLAGVEGRLGANPIETITRASGDWTLYFLCLTLAVTPLRRLTGLNWLLKLRRMLGLFTFFYASLHFVCFIWFDHFFDLAEMARDVVKRPFITVGFTAFLLLLPLALTSSDAMVRRLGRNWARLHRLVYLVAVLAILHFWWMRAGKNNFAEPLLFGAIVALLLGLRLVFRWRAARAAARSLAVEISVKDPG
ncbi:MAG: sulfoxide reductase heme-binding subunit YedZ [Burkholderiaceae bacterium]|nr:sulfoxide reductase heme-binding subunit YedZ [Burkholderiaceae bacterium]